MVIKNKISDFLGLSLWLERFRWILRSNLLDGSLPLQNWREWSCQNYDQEEAEKVE